MPSGPQTISGKSPIRGGSYLPTLDGWRAIAVALVVLNHDKPHRIGNWSLEWLRLFPHQGVGIFFAISGLLICSRLLEEEQIKGRLSLKTFYLRRLFRIQPASLAYLLVIALLMAAGAIQAAWPSMSYSLLLLRDYLPLHYDLRDWYTMHFWSLSVEEHFYLFLPIFLVTVRRTRMPILSALVVLLAIWKFVIPRFWHGPENFGWAAQYRTDYSADIILLAVLLAILLRDAARRELARKLLQPFLIVPLTAFIFWRALGAGHWPQILAVLACPLVVAATMLNPKSWSGILLESAPLRFLGRISYSVYLWQSLFLRFISPVAAPHWRLLAYLQETPWRYVCIFTFSLASYYWIEKPFIKIGHRFAKSPVPGRFETDILPTSSPLAKLADECI